MLSAVLFHFKVFAGKVWETGFFQKAGFPPNPFINSAG